MDIAEIDAAMDKIRSTETPPEFARQRAGALMTMAWLYAKADAIEKAHKVLLEVDPAYFNSAAVEDMKAYPKYHDKMNELYAKLHDAGLVNYLLGFVSKEASA